MLTKHNLREVSKFTCFFDVISGVLVLRFISLELVSYRLI
jgi:hypothetical protein